MKSEQTHFSRALLALLILLSGLAFMPFSGFSDDDLGWQRYGGVYQAELEVEPDRGRPGSAFLFSGSGFGPNQLALVYLEGVLVGAVWTDGGGEAQFLIQSRTQDADGDYLVTMATDGNASASEDFELESDEPLEEPPPGFDGSVFGLQAGLHLPFFAHR